MAQTGYTPILIYSSSTVSQAPSAGNLTNSTLGSELAINITDGKLFYKDNAGVVQILAVKMPSGVLPAANGGTATTNCAGGSMSFWKRFALLGGSSGSGTSSLRKRKPSSRPKACRSTFDPHGRR